MTIQEFFNKYNGKYVGGDQCANLANTYIVECLGNPIIWGNAIDMYANAQPDLYEKILNNPNNFPQLGDVIIWGQEVGQYGHVAIVNKADVYNFQSFDQNWPVGSPAHYQDHNYYGVHGWLRPKKPVVMPVVPPGVPHTPETPTPKPVEKPKEEPKIEPKKEEVVEPTFWELLDKLIKKLLEAIWPKKK